MKRKRNFVISGILILLAGFFSHLAWITAASSTSIIAMVLATLLFMTGIIVFALNFKE